MKRRKPQQNYDLLPSRNKREYEKVMEVGRRRKNKADMTIVEQIAAVKEEVCELYCNRHDEAIKRFGDTQECEDWLKGNECKYCPMGKLHNG